MAETKADKLRREAKPTRSVTLTTKWAAIALALITILFFHDVTIGGRTFVSSDGVAPAGFVRIGEQSLWHDHVYPLWNPFVFLGMPSFGSGAYNPLIYPPADVRAKFYTITAATADQTRERTRLWTTVKTGR